MNVRVIRNQDTGRVVLAKARVCDSFWTRFRGLQWVRHLPEDEGLLFMTASENRVDTAIHMLFMFFSIAVIWLDAKGQVVDTRLAKPWRLAYSPKAPAQFFIEANVSLLERVRVGDRLRFDETVT